LAVKNNFVNIEPKSEPGCRGTVGVHTQQITVFNLGHRMQIGDEKKGFVFWFVRQFDGWNNRPKGCRGAVFLCFGFRLRFLTWLVFISGKVRKDFGTF
jgi:hypothetical protein